ncbi:hypothetical protein [Nocardiopsis dassonvillei]|uniref:hypothetical protein n=1 Tax=Nocardiopsis dassonvillei TaxID=2014 RepID=UPI0036340A27
MRARHQVLSAAQALADAVVPHGADWAWVQQALLRQIVNLGSARRGLRMPWPLPSGAVVPDDAAAAPARLLLDLDADLTDMATVGGLYEVILEHDLDADGRVVKSPDPNRKARGTWYTPPEAAAAMCALALGAGLAQADEHNPDAGPDAVLSVLALDPATGAGVYLVQAARWLAREYLHRLGRPVTATSVASVLPDVITACCYGLDIDPVAVDLTKTALWWEIHSRAPITWLDGHVICASTLDGHLPPAYLARTRPEPTDTIAPREVTV